MNKKIIKKILFIFLLVVGMFFINGSVVEAEEITFPDYGDMSSYNGSYCSYKLGSFRTHNNESANADYYNSKIINLTYQDGFIKIIDPTTKVALYPDTDGYKWSGGLVSVKPGVIRYATQNDVLVNHLVDSNGNLKCGSLSFWQSFGTLYIQIDSDANTDFTIDGVYHGPTVQSCNIDAINKIKNEVNNHLESQTKYVINSIYDLINKGGADRQEYINIQSRVSTEENALNAYKNTINKVDTSICSSDVKTELDNLINTLDQRLNTLKTASSKLSIKLTDLGYHDLADWFLEASRVFERVASDLGSGNGRMDCEGLLGTKVLDDIKEILNYVRIIVPILVIILGIVDFSKVVLGGDEKEMSKAISNLVKRLIAAVAIFFAPIIIMMIIDLVDSLAGGCDIRGW